MYVDAHSEFENGFTIIRLAEVFEISLKDAKRFMEGVEPDDYLDKQRIWKIKTAAPHLMSLENVDIEPRLRKMKPSDLPSALSKELWTALNQRSKYYETRGDLWSTGRVYEVVTSIMKMVRNTSRLFVSSLDGSIEMSAPVRKALQSEMDKLLSEIRERILDAFSDYNPSKDHGDKLEEIYGSGPRPNEPIIQRRTETFGPDVDPEEDDSWLDDL